MTNAFDIRHFFRRVLDYVELTKPRLTLLVLVTAGVAYVMAAPGPIALSALASMVFGVGLVSGGAAALNQYLERDLDARMERTRNRPLPAGRIAPVEALAFGLACVAAGTVWLQAFANGLTAMLGLLAALIYLGVYTPLKTRTSMNTFVGAIVGALPPMMGWAAAAGELSTGAWVLAAILFFWQLPHFFAIAWCYRDDYLAADMKMLGIRDDTGWMSAGQVMAFSLILLPVSLLPAMAGIAGTGYSFPAPLLSLLLPACGIALMVSRSRRSARRLFLASLVYLPGLLGLMMWDRVP